MEKLNVALGVIGFHAWPMSLNTNECIGRQAERKDHEGQSHGQRGDTMDKGQLMIIPCY